MADKKTDKSVQAGLEIEAGHSKANTGDNSASSYDKGYEEDQYDKQEEGEGHYNKSAENTGEEKDSI